MATSTNFDPDFVPTDDEYSSEDSYSDGDEDTEELAFQHSYYVEDARSTIVQHMDITNANALAINKKMQENLLLLKTKLEEMLRLCRQRYKDNEQALVRKTQGKTEKQFSKRESSCFFYGYPFFKNHNLLAARPNADYLYRKSQLGEYFPIEIDDTPIYWVIMDKVCLINGVREQIVNRLVRNFKDRKRKMIKESAAADSELALTEGEYQQLLCKKRLLDLTEMITETDRFTIDWFSISQTNLDDRHKPNTVEAIWNAYLMPSLNRKQWTPEEDDLLLNAIASCVPLDWREVVKRMNRRSLYQCLVHYRTKLVIPNSVNSGRWTAEEDALLLKTVDKYRIGSDIPWRNVVAFIPNRNKAQVYQRYTLTLKPGISRERFSVEEDCKIMAAYKEFGSNFQLYTHILPGRTNLQIRNRYRNVLSFVGKRSNWTLADDTVLMDHVAKHGTSKWSEVAELLGHHTRTSCRSRYTAITKHIAKNPNCDLESVPRRQSKMSSDVTSDNWVEKIIEAKQASFCKSRLPSKGISNLDRECYNYFKYSYQYNFASVPAEPTPTTDHTTAVCRALHCDMCPVDNRLLTALPSATIDLNCLDESESNEETSLPTDRCSALLLRGMSIMFPEDLSETDRVDVRTSVSHPAIDLFRLRFATLLNNTALWSKNKKNQSASLNKNVNITIDIDPRLKDPPKDLNMCDKNAPNIKPPKAPRVYGGKKRRNSIPTKAFSNSSLDQNTSIPEKTDSQINHPIGENNCSINLSDDSPTDCNIILQFENISNTVDNDCFTLTNESETQLFDSQNSSDSNSNIATVKPEQTPAIGNSINLTNSTDSEELHAAPKLFKSGKLGDNVNKMNLFSGSSNSYDNILTTEELSNQSDSSKNPKVKNRKINNIVRHVNATDEKSKLDISTLDDNVKTETYAQLDESPKNLKMNVGRKRKSVNPTKTSNKSKRK